MRRILTLLLVCLLAMPLALLDARAGSVLSNADGRGVVLSHDEDQPCCDIESSVRTAGHCVAVDLTVDAPFGVCRQAPVMALTYTVRDDGADGLLPSTELDPPRPT